MHSGEAYDGRAVLSDEEPWMASKINKKIKKLNEKLKISHRH